LVIAWLPWGINRHGWCAEGTPGSKADADTDQSDWERMWAVYQEQLANYHRDMKQWRTDKQSFEAELDQLVAEQRIVDSGVAWQKAWDAYKADMASWEAKRDRFIGERDQYKEALRLHDEKRVAQIDQEQQHGVEVDRYEQDVSEFNRLPPEQQSREEYLSLVRRKKELDRRRAELDAAEAELDRSRARLDQWRAKLMASQTDLKQRNDELRKRERNLQGSRPPWIDKLPELVARYKRKERESFSRAAMLDWQRQDLESRDAKLKVRGDSLRKRKSGDTNAPDNFSPKLKKDELPWLGSVS